MAAFTLTYNFQGSRILGALRGHLSDSVIFLSGLAAYCCRLNIEVAPCAGRWMAGLVVDKELGLYFELLVVSVAWETDRCSG